MFSELIKMKPLFKRKAVTTASRNVTVEEKLKLSSQNCDLDFIKNRLCLFSINISFMLNFQSID